MNTFYKNMNKDSIEELFLSAEVRCMIRDRILIYISCKGDSYMDTFISKKNLYNTVSSVMGEEPCKIDFDDTTPYCVWDESWIDGRLDYLLWKASSYEYLNIIYFLIRSNILKNTFINDLFEENKIPIKFEGEEENLYLHPVDIFSDSKTDSERTDSIQVLKERAENAISRGDSGGLLHTVASIYEAIGCDVIEKTSKSTFNGEFEKYRKKSKLPKEFLDYIKRIVEQRNVEPNAGHGNLKLNCSLSKEDMIVMLEMAKAIVRIEDKCRQ